MDWSDEADEMTGYLRGAPMNAVSTHVPRERQQDGKKAQRMLQEQSCNWLLTAVTSPGLSATGRRSPYHPNRVHIWQLHWRHPGT